MYRIWMMFDPRQVLVGMHVFLALLAFTIHFTLLSTERYNWLDFDTPSGKGVATQMSALPPSY